MKIAVIGAGVTGLAISKILRAKGFEITTYETNAYHGGIARTTAIDGIAYHTTGGHCFNSKHNNVLGFVFEKILPREYWHQVDRKSRINFKGHLISYPIEYAIKEIAEFDLPLAVKMVQDYFETGEEDRSNLARWFASKFGETLASEYFIPYNQKIWNQCAEDMSPDWVEDKLPIPDKANFTKALLKSSKDSMPHSKFFYPSTGNQNTFLDALAVGLDIIYDVRVNSIAQDGKKWVINGQDKYDSVVSTVPLNLLPNLIENCPCNIALEAGKLRYNKVTTMFWRTKGNQDTWTYYPGSDTIFHRHIHIGNFFIEPRNYSITEAVGERSFEEMKVAGSQFDYLIEPLSCHVSDHAYVVFDQNYNSSKGIINSYLGSLDGLYSLGRFGEWEYYNMDICIKSALELSERIART